MRRPKSGDSSTLACNHRRELFLSSTSVTGQLALRVVIDYLVRMFTWCFLTIYICSPDSSLMIKSKSILIIKYSHSIQAHKSGCTVLLSHTAFFQTQRS